MFSSLGEMGIQEYDTFLGYDVTTRQDLLLNEVRVVNVGNDRYLTRVGAFPQLRSAFGLSSCGVTHNGCALSKTELHSNKDIITDVLINSKRYPNLGRVSPTNVRCDTCLNQSGVAITSSVDQLIYRTLVHEMGHAVGIGHGSGYSPVDAVMTSGPGNLDLCSPLS